MLPRVDEATRFSGGADMRTTQCTVFVIPAAVANAEVLRILR